MLSTLNVNPKDIKIYYVNNINKRSPYKKEEFSYLPYYVNKNNKKHIPKQGQLKLLLNEIRFLTEDVKIQNLAELKFNVLYIGSGKGYHLPYLIELYKKYNIDWWFYDPAGHCQKLLNLEKKNIHIVNDFFTKNDIEKFKLYKNLLFISDIRTINPENTEPVTINLLYDYELQNTILTELKPMFSLIKFRLPFPDDWKSNYDLKIPFGKEYIQAFSPYNSSEFRIFLTDIISFKNITDLDEILLEYEEKFSWYNKFYRFQNDNDLLISIKILNKYNSLEEKYLDQLDLSNIYDILISIIKNF